MRGEIELSDEQAGFQRGRSTAYMLLALQVLTEKTVEMDGHDFVVLIDYSKAFDRIRCLTFCRKWDFIYDKHYRRSIGSALQ